MNSSQFNKIYFLLFSEEELVQYIGTSIGSSVGTFIGTFIGTFLGTSMVDLLVHLLLHLFAHVENLRLFVTFIFANVSPSFYDT